MKQWVVHGALMLGAGTVLASQNPVPQFSSAVQVVEVYASVSDAAGPVTGLSREDFEVLEDGRPREIDTFAAGQFPLTVVLGIDRSFSMAGDKLRLAKRASQAFLNALTPSDRSMVVAISSEADIITALSTDRLAQARALEAVDAWSTTALYDAVVTSLDRLEPEAGRQALVIFSDGVDRYSRATPAQALERARRSRALIYPVVVGRTRPPVTAELAAVSGGRSFLLRDTKELDATLQTIARELRYQYLLGYVPPDIRGGANEWRSIQVRLRTPRPGLRVRARDGYFTD